MADAFVYDAVRTPRGKGKKDGSLHEVPAVRLGAKVLEALRDRNGFDTAEVDDIIFGCVDPVGEALHFLRMSGTFYCRSEFTAPWGLALPAMPVQAEAKRLSSRGQSGSRQIICKSSRRITPRKLEQKLKSNRFPGPTSKPKSTLPGPDRTAALTWS